MPFQYAHKLSELLEGEKCQIVIDNKEVLLVNLAGTVFALDDRCPHLGGSLFEGDLMGSQIICPKHGASFDVKTGKNEGSAKIAFIKMKVRDAKTYKVKVDGDNILVDLD